MLENILDVRLLHAAKTLTAWNNTTSVPKIGEVCLEIQGNTPPLSYKIKIGDGTTSYALLPYFGSVINTNGNASVVAVDTVTDGGITKKVLKFYKLTLTTSTTNGSTTITPAIGDLILTIQEGTGINFATNGTNTLVEVELEAVTADTAQTISDGGTFTTVTKDSNDKATKYTTFTLPSITDKISELDVADNTVITAEWDNTNKQIKLYYIKESDGKIQKGSLAYTINAIDIAPVQSITEGTKIDVSSSNGNYTITHESTTRTNTTGTKKSFGDSVVAGVSTDSTGHVTGVETSQLPDNPVIGLDMSDPTASGNGLTFIDTISQSSGQVTATKKTVQDGNTTQKGVVQLQDSIDTNNTKAVTPNAVKNYTDTKITDVIEDLDSSQSADANNVLTSITQTDGKLTGKTQVSYTTIAPVQNVTTTDTGDSGLEVTTSNNTKDVHHKTVAQNDTDNSSIIDEKELPVITGVSVDSYGHVTGVTKDVSTNLIAADIKAPIKQTDNSMWNHRVTGGTINIGEETAKVSKLRGNTLVWNQLVDTSTSSVTLVSQHKYYTVVDGTKSIQTGANSAISVTGGTDVVVDLTKMFGAGNEPTTVEEFEAMFPNSYYPYNEGELISLNPTGVKSIGFNQWDEEWELGTYTSVDGTKTVNTNFIRSKNLFRILPNTLLYYKKHNRNRRVLFYDATKKYIGSDSATSFSNDTFTTPSDCGYIAFYEQGTTYNHDICINIFDPSRNGTYEPYKETTLDLSWIKSIKDNGGNQLFPNGLLSAGDVYDEVGENYAIKRVDVRNYTSTDDSDSTVITDGTTTYYPLATPITVYFDKKSLTYPVDDLGTETLLPENGSIPVTAPFCGQFEYKSNFKDTVLDLVERVNNARNPVKGATNTNQTVDKLAIYDSVETIKSSNYSPSNATIVEGATDNDIILPSVKTVVDYVNTKLSSALTYKGTVSEWSDLPTSGQNTGDMYIADTIFTEGGVTYQAGDFFIWNGTDWDIVSGTTSVVNSNPTISLNGSTYQVGTVDGVALQVTTPNLDYSSPTTNGTSLEYIDSVSQSNGLISATKKSLPNASTTQTGVTSFVTDIHYSTDNEKTATAKQIWVECEKRNVQFVEAGVVPTGLPMTEDEFINTYAYGVKWVQGSSECTRVGNSSLHETMPIHNALRACVYQIVPQEVTVTETIDGVDYTLNYGAKREFRYWLDDDDWNKKADGTPSVLTGEDMTGIAIWHPKFYGKSFDGVVDGSTSYNSVYVSLVQYDNTWTEIKEGYVDFAKMQIVSSNGVNYARSFGNPDFSVDNPSTTEMTLSAINTWIQTQKDSTQSLVKSQVSMNRLTANQYAVNAGAHLMSLDEYKWIFCWLPVIECAAFTVEENTHFDWQDGSDTNVVMRDSLSNIPSWVYYGMYSANYSAIIRTCGWAFVPAGYTNKLGTHTGWIKMKLPNSGGTYDSEIASRWRGFEIQRNIWTNLMGVNPVQTNTSDTVDVYSTKNRALWNNDMPIDITDESTSTHTNIMPWDSRDAEEPEYTTLTGWEHKGIQKCSGYGTEFDLGSDGNPTYRTLGSSKPDYHYGTMSNANPRCFSAGGSANRPSSGGPFCFSSSLPAGTATGDVGFRCCWNIDEYNSVLN